jgi:hypothetical protein
MPRGRDVRRGRARPPIHGLVSRGRVVEQEPLNRPVDRRIWRGVDEHTERQQIEPHVQPSPKADDIFGSSSRYKWWGS